MVSSLPSERWEQKFPEEKPLYSDAEAFAEAHRCLFCFDAPCTKACPTGVDVAVFIRRIAEDNLRGAAKIILDANILGYSCGRVCPDEVLCAGSCVLKDFAKPTIEIARLQRYATESFLKEGTHFFPARQETGKKIACIGAGPASLACAHELKLLGHTPVVFEKSSLPGGLNSLGIAPYKMQANDALLEVEYISHLGIDIRTGVEIGRDIEVQELLRDYDALFIGIGMGEDTELKVPGVDGSGVVLALEWIEKMKASNAPALLTDTKRALVVGGGNTALDAARELAQLGVPDVTMVYRRTAQVMPGFRYELDAARLEGVKLMEHAVITEIVHKGDKLEGAKVRMPDWETFLPADLIIIAIGQTKWRSVPFPDVRLNDAGEIVVDMNTGRTSNPRIYAGGDATPGMKLVVQAVHDGKIAARTMHHDLLSAAKGGR